MKFNTRQLKYREYRLSGMTSKASAIKAGYSPKTALSGKVEKTIDLATALEVAGLTDKVISARVVDRALNDDGLVGLRYLEVGLKLQQRPGYTQDKAQSTTQAVQINITLPESGIAPRIA